MKRRYTLWTAVVIAFALLAAACGGGESGDTTTTAADTTTTEATTTTVADTTTTEPLPPLVVWADANQSEAIAAVGAAFTEATGVELIVEIVDRGTLKDDVILNAPAGEGPDLFAGAHDWIGELASNGVIAPIDLGGREGDFLPNALTAMVWDGEQMGMPFVTEAMAMYYNPDLVEGAPETMEDLKTACDALDSGITCLAVPGGNDGGDAYHHQPFITAYGGHIFGLSDAGFDGSDVLLDSPETVQGIELLESLVTDGYVPSMNYGDAKNAFVNGEAAFWMTGPWELGALDDPEQNIAAPNWSVAKFPTVEGNPMRPHVGIQGFYMSAYANNAAIAQEFLLNFVATDDTMLALFNADPRGTAFLSVLDSISDNPVAATFAASAADGTFMPNIPEMGAVWGPVGDNFLLLRNGESTAADTATNAQEQVVAAIEAG
ncbi:MAG: extracellular solute-binding protein [Actinomycetota bacterium]